jgi:flagellar motor component MotA
MTMNASEEWKDLARVWQTDATSITGAEIQELHQRHRRRLHIARVAELACTALGVIAALWLALASRLPGVGIVTAVFSIASAYFVVRTRREPAPMGSTNVLEAIKDSLAYQD